MKLLIAIPSNTGRASLPFPLVRSLINMVTFVIKHDPTLDIDIRYFGGLRIDAVRNGMIQYAQDQKVDKILFLDDDMIFPEDMIVRLMAHNRPIVSALYGSKSYPFHYFVMPIESPNHQWLTTIEKDLYQVKTLATGRLLIDMAIFDKLTRPYFLLRMDQFGRITTTEDCFFGLSCFHFGLPMFVDTTLQCQHLRLVAFPKFLEHPQIHYDKPAGIGNPADRVIQIHPQSGLLWSDGIDECAHTNQRPMIVNEGEDPHYKCLDCGLITKGLKVEDMEKIADANY